MMRGGCSPTVTSSGLWKRGALGVSPRFRLYNERSLTLIWRLLMRPLLSRAVVFGLALFCAVPAARAQTVDDIIAKNLEAKGGWTS